MENDTNSIIQMLKKDIVDNKKGDLTPKAILIGGLPGAGKTQLCKSLLIENSNKEFVVIDVDDYRKYSPIFTQNNSTDIIEMTELSAEFCNQVASELLEYALQKRKNIIINTTLRETNLMLHFINDKFVPMGYNVDVAVLSVPLEECIISSQERYEKQIEDKEFPRFTTIEFMKDAQVRINETIRKIEQLKEINKIEVYIRGTNEKDLPIKIYNSEDEAKNYHNAIEAIEYAKTYKNQGKKNHEQLKRLENLLNKRENRKANPQECKEILDMINYYKKKIQQEQNREMEH